MAYNHGSEDSKWRIWKEAYKTTRTLTWNVQKITTIS